MHVIATHTPFGSPTIWVCLRTIGWVTAVLARHTSGILVLFYMIFSTLVPPTECQAAEREPIANRIVNTRESAVLMDRDMEEFVEGDDAYLPVNIKLADIIDVWTRRAERIRTVVLEWEGEITYGKGSLFWSPGKIARHRRDATSLPLVPESDVTFHTRGRLAWDRMRNRFKLQNNIPTWNAETGRHFQQDIAYAMHSEAFMSFFGTSKSAPRELQLRGYLRHRKESEGLPGKVEIPLLVIALFPFGESLSPVKSERETDWTLLSHQVIVEGYPCLVLSRRSPDFRSVQVGAEASELIIVNPAMDFCVMRRLHLIGGHIHRQQDFEYTYDDEHGWLASGWRSLLVGKDHQLRQQFEHSITARIINEEITTEELDPGFTVGTWVKDKRTSQEWIVTGNGRRPITPAELKRGATHAELIASDSGKARIGTSQLLSQLRIWAVVCLVSCAYFVFKRSRRSVERYRKLAPHTEEW